jgi:hypothetical protein
VDAALAWTVVGSCAGIAGVALAVTAAVLPARAPAPRIRTKLGSGQLDRNGVLYVEFESGESSTIALPEPEGSAIISDGAPEKPWDSSGFTPVIAVFIYNSGNSGVTLTRCQYSSVLGRTGFMFEPLAGASERGDRLPRHLGPGEEAVLIHNWATMRVFLNQVMLDHETEVADFQVFLMQGNGDRVEVPSSMHIHADMTEDEVAAYLTEHKGALDRMNMADGPSIPVPTLLPNKRRRRRP